MYKLTPILLILFLFSCDRKKNDQEQIGRTEVTQQANLDHKSFIGKDFLIDDQHSYIGFKIKYFGFSPVRGRFNNFNGTMFLNKSDTSIFFTNIFIEVSSINTGNKRRDNDLTTEGTWFNQKEFPSIGFQSKNVSKKPDGAFDLIGNLTIKGITKEVNVSFDKSTPLTKDWAGNDQIDFSGSVTINRQDFNVFGGDFWSTVMENGLTQLSDEVEIEIDIHARRADYQIRYNEAEADDVNKMILDRIKASDFTAGDKLMDSLFNQNKLTSGKYSSVGYTLNTWGMHEDALSIFQKRQKVYPKEITTPTQIGITNLYLERLEEAEKNFQATLEKDSTNTRAVAYLRLLDLIKENQNGR
ncbi:MAG: hypothetical protein Sapg2KO_45430 [Saprospiraceae bacterium]